MGLSSSSLILPSAILNLLVSFSSEFSRSVIILLRYRISTVLKYFFVFTDVLYLMNHYCQSSLNIFLIADLKRLYAKSHVYSLMGSLHWLFLLRMGHTSLFHYMAHDFYIYENQTL